MYVVNKKKKKKKKFHFVVFLNFLLFFCIIISVGLGVNYIVKNAPVFDKRNLRLSSGHQTNVHFMANQGKIR